MYVISFLDALIDRMTDFLDWSIWTRKKPGIPIDFWGFIDNLFPTVVYAIGREPFDLIVQVMFCYKS